MRLIDADALIETGKEYCDDDIIYDQTIFYNLVAFAPTVEAVPVKHGRWIPTHDRGMFSHPYSITYVCSECGYSFYTLAGMPPKTKYCCECGAKMDEVNDEP